MNRAVGLASQLFVVSDDDERLAISVAQVEEEAMQLFLVLGVQTAAGFIGKHHGRTVDQRTCHCHTLLFATGQFVGLVTGTGRQVHEGEEFLGTLACLLPAHPTDEGGYHDILQCGELGQQLVELEDKTDVAIAEMGLFLLAQPGDVLAIDDDLTAIGLVQRAHNLQEGRLAGSTGSYDTYDLAIPYLQVDATKDLQLSETFCYIECLYHVS